MIENLQDAMLWIESYRQWNILFKWLLAVAGVAIVILIILWRLNKGKWIRSKREAEGGRKLLEAYKEDAQAAVLTAREDSQPIIARLLGTILEQEYKIATIHYDGYSWDESKWALTLFFRVQNKTYQIARSYEHALRESCELLSQEYARLPRIEYELRSEEGKET